MSEETMQDWLFRKKTEVGPGFELAFVPDAYGTTIAITAADGERSEWMIFGNTVMQVQAHVGLASNVPVIGESILE